ncbi:MAG: carboxymuconolactone decarboxylase family protein [Methanotrichaceae archaeon]
MSFENDLENILKDGVDQTADDMLKAIENMYGEVPYIFSFMKDQPELLITKILYNDAIFRSSQALDQKTIELISISVSAAIRCRHCLKLHLRIAKRMDISDDEIVAALMIAGNLANATVLAMATRELNEAKNLDEDRKNCNICQINNGNSVDI